MEDSRLDPFQLMETGKNPRTSADSGPTSAQPHPTTPSLAVNPHEVVGEGHHSDSGVLDPFADLISTQESSDPSELSQRDARRHVLQRLMAVILREITVMDQEIVKRVTSSPSSFHRDLNGQISDESCKEPSLGDAHEVCGLEDEDAEVIRLRAQICEMHAQMEAFREQLESVEALPGYCSKACSIVIV